MTARAELTRDGRWGVQQKIEGVWISATMNCGYRSRAAAESTWPEGKGSVEFRAYDRTLRTVSSSGAPDG